MPFVFEIAIILSDLRFKMRMMVVFLKVFCLPPFSTEKEKMTLECNEFTMKWISVKIFIVVLKFNEP